MSIIYKARRVGKNGKIFTLYKFRTLVENADRIGGSTTSDNDPRITRVGRVLRKTKLDELPQLYNWLKGDIALIGWRPESPEYLDTIPPEVLATKPGIFGLATLWDMDEGKFLQELGAIDPDAAYREVILPQKRKLELQYVQTKSFSLNAKILAQTLWRLITRH